MIALIKRLFRRHRPSTRARLLAVHIATTTPIRRR